MDPQNDIIAKRFGELPPNVQQFAGQGSVWGAQVRQIAQTQGLSEEQVEGALLEFILVTLGLAHIDDYAMEIRERGVLSQETTQAISDSVRALIPADVLASLDEICKKELAADGGVGANVSQPMFGTVAPAAPTPAPMPAPVATPTPAGSMFEEKLKRVFSVPRQDSSGISAQGAALSTPPPAPPMPPSASDPYREPLA